MSTLSISPAFAPSTTRVPRLAGSGAVRLTRRGRIVFLAAFLVVAFAVMVAVGGWATATRDAGTPEQVRTIVVHPGDTLYDIAGRISGHGDVRSMVHRIEQLNSLSGAGLQVGQKLAIPAG